MRLTRAAGTWAATIPHKVDADWSRPAARLAVCLCAGHQEGCVRQRRPSRQRMRTGPPSAGPRAHIKTTNSKTPSLQSAIAYTVGPESVPQNRTSSLPTASKKGGAETMDPPK